MLVDGVALKDEGSVKILDFGIAKIVNADRGEMEALTMTGEIFGSPLYMSPEQCSGDAIDQRSDVYSLGCVLFEALTGTPPLVGNNALRTMMLHVNDTAPSLREAALGSQFPEVFENIVAKMLAKSPSDRYSDLGAVAHEIHSACAGSTDDSPGLSDRTQKTSTAGTRKSTVTFTPVQLASVVVATTIVSSIITLCISHYRIDDRASRNELITEEAKPEAIDHGFVDAADVLSAHSIERKHVSEMTAKMAFENCSSIAATDIPGVKKRRIVFPDSRCGSFKVNAIAEDGSPPLTKQTAIRTVTVPADKELFFVVEEIYNGEAIANPYIFDKIDRELFCGLYFEGDLRAEIVVAQLLTKPKKHEQSQGVLHLFRTVSKWKNLTFLNLRKVAITKDLWSVINELPHLQYLCLHEDDYDPRLLAEQPFLQRLHRVDVFDGDMSEMLKALSKSQMINHITFGKDVTFTPASIQSLRSASKLQELNFFQSTTADSTIDAIDSLTQVDQISFPRGTLSEKQRAKLAKAWSMDQTGSYPLSAAIEMFRRQQ